MITLLLCAAGCSAFAQTTAAASALEASASSHPVAHVKPIAVLSVSALAAAPSWQQLTPTQRKLFAPLETDWDKLGPNQRSKWLSAAPRLAALPEPELTRLHERMRDWANLTPSERADARVGFQVAKQVDAEQRQAKWEAYQALPPDKRQELNDKAAARRQAQTQPTSAAPKMLPTQQKSNIVPAAPKLVPQIPVTGSLVQAKPGATTVLITRGPALPGHHVAGETKVVADPALVDPKTLLPKALPAATPRS